MSDYKNTPAFPEINTVYGSRRIPGTDSWKEGFITYSTGGMTLLDYMAGQALTGALSSPETIKTMAILDENNTKFASLIAEYCYEISKEMLKEKERIESENK